MDDKAHEPLLADIDKKPQSSEDDDSVPNEEAEIVSVPNEDAERTPATKRELLIRTGGVANFFLQCLNIGLLSTTGLKRGMVYVSSSLGTVSTPVVVYKERILTKEDTFRQSLNGIREEQGRLADQNDALTASVDRLGKDVARMKDTEKALRGLAEAQGLQLYEIMDLIEENKEINKQLRGLLKSATLDRITGLLLDMDVDGSFTIEDLELERLMVGMEKVEDIFFDKELFREDVNECGGQINEVLEMVKEMIFGSGDVPLDFTRSARKRRARCKIEFPQDPVESCQKFLARNF